MRYEGLVKKIFMANLNHCKSIICEEFFKPFSELFHDSKHGRKCPILKDQLWMELGVRRCLHLFQSGRDFLQYLADTHDTSLKISTFFESLKSKRRLTHLREISQLLCARMAKNMPDPFAAYSSLNDFELYAGDGHFIEAATHDKAKPRGAIKTSSDPKQTTTRQPTTKYATGHLYTINLRSHAMSHLAVADQQTRKKEHEMRTLKRQTAEQLRQQAAKGRKVLYVWDRAGIDFRQWSQWKNQNGIYFLSREKENMKLTVMGKHRYDEKAAINLGIIDDEILGTSMGVSIRRVTYKDAETGIIYKYLTNLPTSVPPGIIVLLYKSRWDIEKVFDEFKNNLGETKSWASSEIAKTNQALLLCLTHNLMTIMEEQIRKRTGIENKAELKRRKKRRDAREQKEKEKGGKKRIAHLNHAADRLTQRTKKFIRWLKNHLDIERDWDASMARLTEIYARL